MKSAGWDLSRLHYDDFAAISFFVVLPTDEYRNPISDDSVTADEQAKLLADGIIQLLKFSVPMKLDVLIGNHGVLFRLRKTSAPERRFWLSRLDRSQIRRSGHSAGTPAPERKPAKQLSETDGCLAIKRLLEKLLGADLGTKQ